MNANGEMVTEIFNNSRYNFCHFCEQEMTLNQKLHYIGGMTDMLIHWDCRLPYPYSLIKDMNLKSLIKDNTVYFTRYRKGFLYYVIKSEDSEYEFSSKAILFMRYIRKAIEEKTFNKI
jgi:hypothetical protein